MKLLTKAIRKSIPGQYATEDIPADDKIAAVKFFDPTGSWTWYAVEGYPYILDATGEELDYMFFGWVDGHYPEWGYFSLNELSSTKVRFGLGIERDLYWTPKPMKEVRNYE